MSSEIKKSLKVKCAAVHHFSPSIVDEYWKNDEEFVIHIVKNTKNPISIPREVLENENLIFQLIKANPDVMKEIKEKMDDEFYLRALEASPFAIEYCPESFKDDFDLMKKIVSRCGLLLVHASKRLKSNKEIILEAVKENSDAMSHVPKEFRNDKVVMMEVVRKQPMALYYASDELKADLDVVIPAVHLNYQCLIYLPFEFRNSTPVYLASRRMYLDLVFDEKIRNLSTVNFQFN